MIPRNAFSKLPKRWRLADQPLAVQFWIAGGIVAFFSALSLVFILSEVQHQPGTGGRVPSLVILIDAALLLIFGVTLAKLYFSIARPIFLLSKGIQRYQQGEFNVRVAVSNRSQIGVLEVYFNEMAEKIEAMVLDLKKLDELKSEFISTVSHELRTPLTSIGGYTKLLLSGDAGPVTETQREFLMIVDTNVVRLTHLINDILDIEKMESGKVQIAREPQDLVAILKECRKTFDIVAAQKELELRFKVPEKIKAVLGDRSRLVQVFMNLISNAIKYTKSGYVGIEAEEQDFAVMVRIRDTGVGLTPDEREKLFQKFYRTRSGLSSSEGGTGLGLAIARGLVEAHGGRISVESIFGAGTTFTVTLPSVDWAASRQKEMKPSQATPVSDILTAPSSRPIWIIDPNSVDADHMKRTIEAAGPIIHGQNPRVLVFGGLREIPDISSAAEAPIMVVLEPSAEIRDHALISDLRKKIRRTVPILVVSSSIDTAVAFAEGASALLTKPVGERELLIAVKDLILTRGLRILVADRNTDLRILIKRSLEQRGFKVDDVDRGNLVLARLEQEEYDLTLLDLNFPDVSGVELLKVIRRDARFKLLPVFVMLDEGKNPPSPEALESWGADQFVGKYRGIAGIVEAVCQFLDEKGA